MEGNAKMGIIKLPKNALKSKVILAALQINDYIVKN